MFNLREYQTEIVNKGYSKLLQSNLVYLSMEVRTGKTLTALSLANKFTNDLVLFITKKKAIASIVKDYELLKPDYKIEVTNLKANLNLL